MATMTRPENEVLHILTTLNPATLHTMPWQAIGGCPGVRAKELWRGTTAVAALITYEPGARTPGRPHPAAEHHIWVVCGQATIGGRRLVAGAYAHVPAGAAHPIQETGGGGCTMLQLHVPQRAAGGGGP